MQVRNYMLCVLHFTYIIYHVTYITHYIFFIYTMSLYHMGYISNTRRCILGFGFSYLALSALVWGSLQPTSKARTQKYARAPPPPTYGLGFNSYNPELPLTLNPQIQSSYSPKLAQQTPLQSPAEPLILRHPFP